MHYQCRNPLRERDHRISLMPLLPVRPTDEPPLWLGVCIITLPIVAVVFTIVAFT